jgi:hypothetical protein
MLVAVIDSSGKVVMESILETKAAILFITEYLLEIVVVVTAR